MLKRWHKISLILLSIAAALFFASFLFPAAYHVCHPDDYTHAKDCPQYHFGPAVIAWLIANADIHNGLVTAFATIAIACLTVSLRNASNKLAAISGSQTKLIKAQADIAQAQHLAEHRPHLRVRHVFLGTPQVPLRTPHIGSEVAGGLVVVNVGGTKAKIVDSRYLIHFGRTQNGLPMHSPLDDDWTEMFAPNSPDFGIGESRSLQIVGNVRIGRLEAARSSFITFGTNEWTVYVMGQIRYQDDGGNDRFMGFCRRWSGEGTFEAVPDPDYEYED